MSPYRHDVLWELFGWVADVPFFGFSLWCLACASALFVVVYEVSEYLLKRREMKRAN